MVLARSVSRQLRLGTADRASSRSLRFLVVVGVVASVLWSPGDVGATDYAPAIAPQTYTTQGGRALGLAQTLYGGVAGIALVYTATSGIAANAGVYCPNYGTWTQYTALTADGAQHTLSASWNTFGAGWACEPYLSWNSGSGTLQILAGSTWQYSDGQVPGASPSAVPEATATPWPSSSAYPSAPPVGSAADCRHGDASTAIFDVSSSLYHCYWAAGTSSGMTSEWQADWIPASGHSLSAEKNLNFWAAIMPSDLGGSLYLRSRYSFALHSAESVTAYVAVSFGPQPSYASSHGVTLPAGSPVVEAVVIWYSALGGIVPVQVTQGGVTSTYQASFGTVVTCSAWNSESDCGGYLPIHADAPPGAVAFELGVVCGSNCPSGGAYLWSGEAAFATYADAQNIPPIACDPALYGCLNTGQTVPRPITIEPGTGAPPCGPLSGDCTGDKPLIAHVAVTSCTAPGALDLLGWVSYISCQIAALPSQINNMMIDVMNTLIDLVWPGGGLATAISDFQAHLSTRPPFSWVGALQAQIDSALASPAGDALDASFTVYGATIALPLAWGADQASPFRAMLVPIVHLAYVYMWFRAVYAFVTGGNAAQQMSLWPSWE